MVLLPAPSAVICPVSPMLPTADVLIAQLTGAEVAAPAASSACAVNGVATVPTAMDAEVGCSRSVAIGLGLSGCTVMFASVVEPSVDCTRIRAGVAFTATAVTNPKALTVGVPGSSAVQSILVAALGTVLPESSC